MTIKLKVFCNNNDETNFFSKYFVVYHLTVHGDMPVTLVKLKQHYINATLSTFALINTVLIGHKEKECEGVKHVNNLVVRRTLSDAGITIPVVYPRFKKYSNN